jgi:Rrf2 family protein
MGERLDIYPDGLKCAPFLATEKFMLSNRAKYGLKALIYIAQHDGTSVQSAEIAAAKNIPKKFLDAILLDIKNSGILFSKKGKGGGFQLAKPARRILVGQVIRLLDGSLAPIECANQTEGGQPCADCSGEKEDCQVRALMREVYDAIVGVLDHRTLEELIQGPAEMPYILRYDI